MLYAFDQQFYDDGFAAVCGVDEAGRGPLAGPVVAAAVILGPDCVIEGLNDSKKLSEKKREALAPVIMEQALAYGIGRACESEIDGINILQASLLAMVRAVEDLHTSPECILIDGNQCPPLDGAYLQAVIKGDATSAAIAAASILAKVTRDRLLVELDQAYPQYQFARHKGYPTKLHYQMLDQYGPSPVHRRSFLRKWEAGRKTAQTV